MWCKRAWLDFAEILDALRVIPRGILVAAYAFTLWYCTIFTEFYFGLVNQEGVPDWKLAAYSVFGGLTIPAIAGLAKGITSSYLATGRDWKAP